MINPPDVILANCLVFPLVGFVLWVFVWLITGMADFLDGLTYWLAFRDDADPDAIQPELSHTAPTPRGGGCWWVVLLVVIGIVLLPFVWR